LGRPLELTTARICGSCTYRKSPGQSVIPVSRCPEISRSFTRVPAEYIVVEPPAETIIAVLCGGRWATSSRHASSCSRESTAAAGGGASWKSPSRATENVPVLKPICDPGMTGMVTPPFRPTNTVPYRSIRKLYAMSQ